MENKFSNFINYALRFLFLFVIGGVCAKFIIEKDAPILESTILLVITILIFIGTYYAFKKGVKYSKIVVSILIMALAIRILWFWSIDSIPVSDFNRMYICGQDFLSGTTYMFKGTAYIARFPHLTITVLYFSLVQYVFSNPLVAVKLLNIVYSMVNIWILYLISKEVFKDKSKHLIVLLLSALYPPMIIYNNCYCSENMAMPLFLLSILYFLRAIKEEVNFKYLIGSSVLISVAHLFRPMGYVVITAYVIYVSIYIKSKWKNKIIADVSIILGFFIPVVIVSYTLMALNITENHLWRGAEPSSVFILKGTNLKSQGRWSKEDAELFDKCDRDYDKTEKESKRIIKERLTKTPKLELIKFYSIKYAKQWRTGEFGGACWVESGLDEAYNKEEYLSILGKDSGKMLFRVSTQGIIFVEVFYAVLIILTYVGLYTNKKNRNLKTDLFYILFCGFSLQCLITESQDRYTYIVSWIFIILSVNALKPITINKSKDNICNCKNIEI